MSCEQIGHPRMLDVFLWHVLVCSTTRFILRHPAAVQVAPSLQFSAWMSEVRHRLIASSRELTYLTRCSCWFAVFIIFEIIIGKSPTFEPPWKSKILLTTLKLTKLLTIKCCWRSNKNIFYSIFFFDKKL